MQVTVSKLGDFIEVLKTEEEILRNRIHYEVTSIDISEVSCDVYFQATAVVRTRDGEYLLKLGQRCGVDRHAESQREGSEMAEVLKNRLQKYGEERNLKLLPGLIET